MQNNRSLTQLSATNVEKSVHFYTHYLGFEKCTSVADVDDFDYAILEKEDIQLLISNPMSQGIIKKSPLTPFGTGALLEFKFKDIFSIYKALMFTNTKMTAVLDRIGSQGFIALFLDDPEDYQLLLIRSDINADIKEETLAQNSLNAQMMFRYNSDSFLKA